MMLVSLPGIDRAVLHNNMARNTQYLNANVSRIERDHAEAA